MSRIALACSLLANAIGCKPRVIDLGRADAALDASLASCARRVRCATATIECVILGSGATCGSDNFCVGSLGTCTTTTPSPCGGSAASTTCTRDVASTVPCGQ